MKLNLFNFRQANVLIVGDIMLDKYYYGSSNRISPEAPVPIVMIDNIEERPGGAANVAMNIATLGAHSHLIGLTGVDNAASILKKQLNKVNVTCNFISLANYPTITKLRVVSRNQQLIRLDFEQKFDHFDSISLLKSFKFALPSAEVLVLSDYNKGTLVNAQEMIADAITARIPILVDPKGNDFSRYRGATLIKPNLIEFEAVAGICKDEHTLINRGMDIINDYKFSAMLITRSEQGMILLQLNKKPVYLQTQAKEVYDVTGAGDTVISILATAIASDHSLEDACFLANMAAGLVVGKLGASTVNLAELENVISKYHKTGFGIVTENELQQSLTLARQRGEKIVMTNGVFDILHIGHIHYLTSARKLGDRLIVAVNSDESTKRIKGTNRPINSLDYRMKILVALEVVDWVISFDEDTPQRIISNICPNLLIKGGDYKPHQIVGSKEVWNNGGDVQVINFKDNCSSTKIIKFIKDKL